MSDAIELTAHCLLRLTTALMLEVHGIPHCQDSATAELNSRSGRRLCTREWLLILEPHYRRRFMPGDTTPLV